MTKEQLVEFEKVAAPLMEYLSNLHPHHCVIVTNTSAELLEGQGCVRTNKFLKD